VRAGFLAGAVELAGIVLRSLGESAGADKLDDLLRQPDRMHQFGQVSGIATGLDGDLPAVLLDSLGGAQETDDGVFLLGLVFASRRSSAPSTSSLWKPRQLRDAHPGGRVTPRSRPGARPPLGRHQVTLAVVNVTTIGLVT